MMSGTVHQCSPGAVIARGVGRPDLFAQASTDVTVNAIFYRTTCNPPIDRQWTYFEEKAHSR